MEPTDEELMDAGIEFYEDAFGDKHIRTTDGYTGFVENREDRERLLDIQLRIAENP